MIAPSEIRLTHLDQFFDDTYFVESNEYYGYWVPLLVADYPSSNHSQNIARVICRQTGKGEPSFLVKMSLDSFGDNQEWHLIEDCTGDEERVQNCRYRYYGTITQYYSTTKNNYAVGVICNGKSWNNWIEQHYLDCFSMVFYLEQSQIIYTTETNKYRGKEICSLCAKKSRFTSKRLLKNLQLI